MTTTLTIPPGERGTVRLFAIDAPPEEARAFADNPAAVARALGAPDLDLRHIDVFPVSRIAPLGLAAFLAEGHDIPAEALAADADALSALDGQVAVLASGAFGPQGRTLEVTPPLRFVGAWAEARPPVTFSTLPSGGAEGVLGGPAAPPATAPRAGGGMRRLLTVLLLILAIIGFIVLNGGR
jgi:hypothetical protein